MNPNDAANWSLNSYTDDEWTDLVAEEAIVATVSICNTAASAVNVTMRVATDADANVARILPTNELAVGEAFTLDLKSLYLSSTQKLQVQCDAAGLEFFVSGAVEEEV